MTCETKTWKVRSVQSGLNSARLWVGDYGRWKGVLGKNTSFTAGPKFDAKVSISDDEKNLSQLFKELARKYPKGWQRWEDRMKKAHKEGSRVLLRYTPVHAKPSFEEGHFMKLGMMVGYSGGQMSINTDMVLEAERLGYDSVWTAEAYGSDAATPLAYIAAITERIKLGTAIFQMPARTPAMTAMTAMTAMFLGLECRGADDYEGLLSLIFLHAQRFGL